MPAITKTISGSDASFSSFNVSRPAPSPPAPIPKPRTRMAMLSSPKSLPHLDFRSKGISQKNGQLHYTFYPAFVPEVRVKAGYVGLQRNKLRPLTLTKNFWMVLRDGVLSASLKEDSEALYYISLNQVHQVDRVSSRRFCLAITASSEVWYLMFKDEANLEDWHREIRARCPLLHIGYPTDFQHDLHVTYDPEAGEITGLPEPWIQTLSVWGVRPDFTDNPEMMSPLSPASFSSEQASSSSASATASTPSRSSHSIQSDSDPRSVYAGSPPPEPLPLPQGPLARHRSASAAVRSSAAPSMVTSVDQFRKSPHRYRDIDARDLTGSVQPVHLLPTIRDENCDIWKAEWSGSFGTRKVALQVIRVPEGGISEEKCERINAIIVSEMRVLHQLRHPNVVRIRGFTRDQGPLAAIVSTWLPRENLMDYLNRHTKPAIGRVERLRYLTEAAAGLNYLHNFSQEILHGNFCGAHIYLNETGNACISGFGINPILQELEHPDTADVTARTGPSPRWAAREVICSERRYMSTFSDVFSFARTVVEVITGKPPYYYIADDEEVIPFVLKGIMPRRPPGFGEDGLWPFLERCWREDFTRRPSMALVLLRLEETLGLYTGTESGSGSAPGSVSVSASGAGAWGRDGRMARSA